MKISVKVPTVINGQVVLQDSSLENLNITDYATLGIDGSTTNTGVSIIRRSDGAQYATIAFTRDKRHETPVEYKVYWKRYMYDLLMRNRLINMVIYEEPFCGYATAAPNLFMLRSSMEELMVEHRPDLDFVTRTEINNKRWKKNLITPEKVPADTELQKAKIREKVVAIAPWMANVSQDEMDAYGMTYTSVNILRNGGTISELESNKPVHKFKYNAQFISADDDEGLYIDLLDKCEAPKSVLENGISIIELKRKENFDKIIYKAMGEDDKLLILKFRSDTHGDIVLEHRLGDMLVHEYIYGIIWRVGRKR